MHTTYLDTGSVRGDRAAAPLRQSARCGVAFAACQLAVVAAMAVLVLPKGGSPSTAPLERGVAVLDAQQFYRVGNFALMVSGMLLLGFLGVVGARLRDGDRSGATATVAVASGTLVALLWPLAGMLHDVALETADTGADARILAGWDAVAPFALALSAMPRALFIGAIVLSTQSVPGERWLRRTGVVVLGASLAGSATLVHSGLFPALAVSTLAFQLWVGALAWRWLRTESRIPRIDEE
ncbi:hypothetical protein [Nocardia arizonensis]|uniref:hypothetical protein n=1 Tax=Nocardia arizonensis TaxID=1141647 RepID=UPI0006D0960F|nr:hypothetical protein [Nocardia arizonensis]